MLFRLKKQTSKNVAETNSNTGSKIWEVKRRVRKKNTVKKPIKDSKGKILQDSKEIISRVQQLPYVVCT